ncbi:hypothetical protein DIPPA_07583 [Diplonema papillatum]|nr:hypothetical protein DIPPA_07583 [Diplonema papillatum]|eukprot:gene19358-29809_t
MVEPEAAVETPPSCGDDASDKSDFVIGIPLVPVQEPHRLRGALFLPSLLLMAVSSVGFLVCSWAIVIKNMSGFGVAWLLTLVFGVISSIAMCFTCSYRRLRDKKVCLFVSLAVTLLTVFGAYMMIQGMADSVGGASSADASGADDEELNRLLRGFGIAFFSVYLCGGLWVTTSFVAFLLPAKSKYNTQPVGSEPVVALLLDDV